MTSASTKTPRADEPPLIDVIAEVRGFTPPIQVRSNEKTHAILAAALSLLQEKSASSIKMQDIADRAGCAVTAIYARFENRDSLFSAIHMLQVQECRPILDRTIRAENFAETGIFGLACAFLDVNDFYFTKNFNFAVAQLRAEDDSAFKVTADFMDAYALRLATVAAVLLSDEIENIVDPIKLAIHTILAIYRDSVLGIRHFKRPRRETLARIFVNIVEQKLIW